MYIHMHFEMFESTSVRHIWEARQQISQANHQNTLSNIFQTHGQTSSTHIVNNHQTTWSNIIKHHGQQSSKTMVQHRKTQWSKIIKHHGQQWSWSWAAVLRHFNDAEWLDSQRITYSRTGSALGVKTHTYTREVHARVQPRWEESLKQFSIPGAWRRRGFRISTDSDLNRVAYSPIQRNTMVKHH
jgi:hypothetical protein